MRLQTTWGLPSLLLLAAGVAGTRDPTHSSLPVRLVHQFPNPTYIDDVRVASNGDVLVTTMVPSASIFSIRGAASPEKPTVRLLHTFSEINYVSGIIETQPGVFAFIGGNQSTVGVGANGTFGIWEIDIRASEPVIREIVHIPESGYLLGVDALPGKPTTILVSDGANCLVWKVDTLTGQYEVAVQDPNMRYPRWKFTPQGIDGIRVHKGYLYWGNSYIGCIYRIPIGDDGKAISGAKSELVTEITTIFLDKFDIGPIGSDFVWATTNEGNRLFAVTPDGKHSVVAGAPDQMTLAGCTAAAFGKLKGDLNTLYVVTAGGLGLPVNGTITEGGKVVAVDTNRFVRSHKTGPRANEYLELRKHN